MVERRIAESRAPTSKVRLARSLSGHADAGQLDRILGYLERSSKIAIDGDAVRWTFGAADRGADRLNRGGGPAELMSEEPACEDDGGRALTWSEAETRAILADPDSMRLLAESDADMRAGRVSAWKPEDV